MGLLIPPQTVHHQSIKSGLTTFVRALPPVILAIVTGYLAQGIVDMTFIAFRTFIRRSWPLAMCSFIVARCR